MGYPKTMSYWTLATFCYGGSSRPVAVSQL